MAPLAIDLGTRLLKGKSDAFKRAGKEERIRLLRKMARSSVPLRLALANDAAAAEVSDLIAQFLKTGADDAALQVAGHALAPRQNPVGRDTALTFARKVTRACKRWEQAGSVGKRPYALRTYRRALFALNAQKRRR